MPTKRAVFVFYFALLFLIGGWVSKVFWLYLAFSFSIGLIIFSFLVSRLLIFNIRIKRLHVPQAYEGDNIEVFLEISNKFTMFNHSIEIKDSFSAASPEGVQKTIFIFGLPRGKFEFFYKETCYKRGRYVIGPCTVKIVEPFGLFYYKKVLPLFSQLMVYPSIFAINRLPFILGHLAPRFGEQTTRISGEYEEFYGVREYHLEDGWRRIHWRSTARLNELTVKHFEQSSQWKALIILDARRSGNYGYGKEATFEYGVKIAASLARFFLLRQASFGLLASTEKSLRIDINKGKKHFYNLLNCLATVEADGSAAFAEYIIRSQRVIPHCSSLIVVTGNYDALLVNALRCIKVQKNVSVIAVILNSASFIQGFGRDFKKTGIVSSGQSERLKKGVKNAFSRISPDVYFINRNDDLRAHFTV